VDRELIIMNRTRAALQSGVILVGVLQEKTKLSSREIEVLSIVGQGYTYKIAAQKLMISPKTVIYHIEHIKEKIGLSSKADLINFYQNHKNHR
jgi:DNA-binding CsgD family transcriptional regulator